MLKADSNLSNKELAYEVGFSGDSVFSRAFTAVKGVSPSEYKKQQF